MKLLIAAALFSLGLVLMLVPLVASDLEQPDPERLAMVDDVCVHHTNGRLSTPYRTRLTPGSTDVVLPGLDVTLRADRLGPCEPGDALVSLPSGTQALTVAYLSPGRRAVVRFDAATTARQVGTVKITGGLTPGRYRWMQAGSRHVLLPTPG